MKVVRWLQSAAKGYFTLAGVMFNLLCAASLAGFVNHHTKFDLLGSAQQLFDPLQNVESCSRWMTGLPFDFEHESHFQAPDHQGEMRDLILLGGRAMIHGKTRQNHMVVSGQVRSARGSESSTQTVAFELDLEGKIARCLPSPSSTQARLTECLAAAGDYHASGDCWIGIEMPSDCEVMGGTMDESKICRVPAHGRILSSVEK